MKRSYEYRATPAGVKRGLKAIGYTQDRAARESDQSPALVSMVLNERQKGQPCLDRLAALIARVRGRRAPLAPPTRRLTRIADRRPEERQIAAR